MNALIDAIVNEASYQRAVEWCIKWRNQSSNWIGPAKIVTREEWWENTW